MATCKECINYTECNAYLERVGVSFDPERNVCSIFKDSSRFVELPCKIGDKVFSLVGKGEIEKWTVTDIYFSDFGVADINILQIKVRSKDKGASFPSHYLGRSFFYTYEEAEKALKERENRVRHHTGFSC